MPEVAEEIKKLRRVIIMMLLMAGKPISAELLVQALIKAREIDQQILP